MVKTNKNISSANEMQRSFYQKKLGKLKSDMNNLKCKEIFQIVLGLSFKVILKYFLFKKTLSYNNLF